jgi:hypothetical protein
VSAILRWYRASRRSLDHGHTFGSSRSQPERYCEMSSKSSRHEQSSTTLSSRSNPRRRMAWASSVDLWSSMSTTRRSSVVATKPSRRATSLAVATSTRSKLCGPNRPKTSPEMVRRRPGSTLRPGRPSEISDSASDRVGTELCEPFRRVDVGAA